MRLNGPFIAFLGLMVLVLPCSGGWISEVWFEPVQVVSDAQQIVTIPRLIEVSGLDPAFAADLVLIDARDSTSRWGLVKQVITLEAGNEVRVISQGEYPASLGGHGSSSIQTGSFQSLVSPMAFDWTGSRSILLFERPTGLEGFTGKIGDVVTLSAPDDVITFGLVQSTLQYEDFADRPIFDQYESATIVRPNMPANTRPWPGTYLSGTPDTKSIINGGFGSYVLNPGLFNRVWPAGQPEPATGVMLLGLTIFFLCTRRRQPADTGNAVSVAYHVMS